MTLAYLLLVLVPAAVIAYLLWSYRRKTAQRDAMANARLEELIATAPQQSSAARTAATTAAPKAPVEAAPYRVCDRILSPSQTLLYYLLRTGIPEQIVLAHVPLSCVLEVNPQLSGFLRDEQKQKLAAHTLDFVLVDRSMKPVCVIVLHQAGAQHDSRSSLRSWLAGAGVRYVELDPSALPRRDAVRAVILGA